MSGLRLAFRMLLRDLRAGELHLLAVALLVAVAALTSVGFLTDRVGQSLNREANQLLGADLLLRSDHPWSPAVAAEAGRRALRVATTTVFSSMASAGEAVELAGVKAVEAGYPLRGSLRIAAAPNHTDAPAGRIPQRGEAWLDERLSALLGVHAGDRIGLGNAQLTVGAMISFESDRGTNFFSVLPRVMINAADLPATGLIQEGSRVTWQLQIAGEPAAVADFQRWAQTRLERGQAVDTVDNARPEVKSALEQARRFLRLAALLAVVLAAVAVGLAARRFLRRHLDGCAVMRCLGASSRRITALVLGEFLVFGLGVSLAGGALGWLAQLGLVGLLGQVVDAELPAASPLPWLQGVVVGLALLAGFALPQLLRLARVPTLRVLRREWGSVEPIAGSAWLAGAAVLLALLLWIADDRRLGLLVAGGFAAALVLFALAAWASLRAVATLRVGKVGAGWRYGLAALRRRLGGSVIQATGLGLGLTALLLITVIRADLLAQWRSSAPPGAPNRFVINIQQDQRRAVEDFFAGEGMGDPHLLPMIRGRLVAVNGRPVGPESYTSEHARRLAEREYNLSFEDRLQLGNRIVEGRWHGEDQRPQWSVEKGMAETLGLHLGDRLTFVIGGQRMEAPITSVRELKWDSMKVNFFFVASRGALDEAPASLITSFYLPPAEHGFTTRLVQAFPNVSVIDIAAVIAQVQAMMDKISHVVQFVFGFALAAGLAVLAAALQATHDEREYELATLRILGARDRQLRGALLAEFAVLGGIAGALAGLGASGIGWALAHYAFKLADYAPSMLAVLIGALAGASGVVLAGWLGTRGLLRRPPLASLRAAG